MKTELLKKIQALASAGVGGEKENANEILNKLLDKYGVSIDDLSDEKTEREQFHYKNKVEKKLLQQIIYKVTNNLNMYGYRNTIKNRKIRGVLGADVTKQQKIEIEFLFDWYKTQFKKEHELFLRAFIQKHNIFGIPSEDSQGENNKLSREDLFRMMNMVNGMEDVNPIRRIEGEV